jgi:maltooligosyltrehalose trehalohydrolase
MHIGTFTKEGTWTAATAQLPELARLGITTLEIMPIADFAGKFGWGYDGVDWFAPTRLYGRPDDLRRFVDRAHALGLGVILDVVYNHFGPDGNYITRFSEQYASRAYATEWGAALNFDGEDSFGVREFVVTNARYWIEEFHLDGLRLDATQSLFDASATHIIREIVAAVREAAGERSTYVVAENEPQNANLMRAPALGGYGVDGVWNDDYHHSAMVALTGKCEAYYSDYRGAGPRSRPGNVHPLFAKSRSNRQLGTRAARARARKPR